MSIKKDIATIEGHLEPLNHEAAAISFDPNQTGIPNDNVQEAIFYGGRIPELVMDPVSPKKGDAWISKVPAASIGSPLGLLLALTHAGGSSIAYEFSYKTIDGVIIRTLLT